MKFAVFTENGLPLAFFDSAVNQIPDDAVEITMAQWREFLDNQGKRRWNGHSVEIYTVAFDEARVRATIKALASEVILNMIPMWKQINMTAKSVEIADKKAQGTATAEEIETSEQIRSVWSKTEAVRTRSDDLEEAYVLAADSLSAADLATIRAELVAAANPEI